MTTDLPSTVPSSFPSTFQADQAQPPWASFVPRYKLVLHELDPTTKDPVAELPLLLEANDWLTASQAWDRLLQPHWLGTLELWQQDHRHTWQLQRGVERWETASGQPAQLHYGPDRYQD